MVEYQYLIVGGGMTADAAVKGIRSVDSEGSIGLISAEPDPPYDRPPLSKGVWLGKELSTIWRATGDRGAELHLNRRAVSLDPAEHTVEDDQGQTYQYQRLLLATGGAPIRLPGASEDVIYFRTYQDYERLRSLAETVDRIAVVGGGFIGSELAAVLTRLENNVTMIFPEEAIGAGRFPPELATYVTDYFRDKGVEVLNGELVESLEPVGQETLLKTVSGQEVKAGAVVAGLGIRPNTQLAESAGLEVDNGIIVDEGLQTSQTDIFAAGDVANFHNPALGRRLRVEHEDNANSMGQLAGQAMAGESVRYDHLPFFYSDMFELGYEALGLMDANMTTRADWQTPHEKGVIYYLEEERVRGVLLWNVWGQLEAATELIAKPEPFSQEDLLPLDGG